MKKKNVEEGKLYAAHHSPQGRTAWKMARRDFGSPDKVRVITIGAGEEEERRVKEDPNSPAGARWPSVDRGTECLVERVFDRESRENFLAIKTVTELVCPWEDYQEEKEKYDEEQKELQSKYEQRKKKFLSYIAELETMLKMVIPTREELDVHGEDPLYYKWNDGRRVIKLLFRTSRADELREKFREHFGPYPFPFANLLKNGTSEPELKLDQLEAFIQDLRQIKELNRERENGGGQ